MAGFERRLVLLRHAHRNTLDVHEDNGLSDKGREQAERVLTLFKGRHPTVTSRDVRLLTSPKQRCLETIAPVAEALGAEAAADGRLTEGGSMETEAMFSSRIERFMEEFQDATETMWIVCSHGDWIPAALEQLTGQRIEVPKAGWVEVRFVDGEARDVELFRCD